MSTDITTLLPNSFSTQNTRRHLVFTAEAQPDELARAAISAADAIAAARAAVRAYEADSIAEGVLDPAFRALADLVRKRQVLDDDFREAAEEAVEYLSRLRADDPQSEQEISRLRGFLADALALSYRVADLITAEHDIRRRRSLSVKR
ncbi:hypothetical protein G5B40_01170 [Pikeienuella piscinae]|uniref:Uncharacterized protein n=1 Tax=Pikeienuella piscinae TaxID=2748098 RepID=A0A7L5BSM9_9RHOB|nr:hypothetical protein [Pikeienuella piscinae]QIE54175.1 hypothetical protein G5B40_01170 [Pikeienuella piscinae]